MAGDPYRKVQSGQRLPGIPAELYNAMVDEVRGLEGGASAPRAGGVFRQAGVIRVRNVTGQILGQFNVVGLGAPVVTPTADLVEFKQRVMLDGAMPVWLTHKNRIAVTLQPLVVNEVGLAVAAGLAPVRLIGQQEGDCAELVSGTPDYMQVHCGGSARIVWQESGISQRWAVVRLGDSASVVKGKLGGVLTVGGSQIMRLWATDAGGVDVDTGQEVTVHDWLMTGVQTLGAGRAVVAMWTAGRWYVVAPPGA